MMAKLNKRGFTLIELMVVIILVLILALALVPTFKEILVKAKYTEGSAAISALRTKIKVYWLENSRLPGLPQDFVVNTNSVGGCSWVDYSVAVPDYDDPAALTTPAVDDAVQRMISREGETQWGVSIGGTTGADDDPIGYVAGLDPLSASPWQDDLNVAIAEYAGQYFRNQNYQYVAMNGGMNVRGYAYAILASGDGIDRAPPIGTAYGVMEIYNPDRWEEKKRISLTWERYKEHEPLDDLTASAMYLSVVNTTNYAASATESYKDFGNAVNVPNWATISNLTVTVGSQNLPNLSILRKEFGWE